MKLLKTLFKWLAILIGILIIGLYATDTDYLIKAVRTIYLQGYTTAYLEDYKKFDNQIIENGTPHTSGPLPISVAFLIGLVFLPFSIR